ncbi:MAG: alkaline phosphatase family protein, partial [bacterium]
AVFFMAIVYYYTWQWARWEFIVFPLLPIANPQVLDLGFMLLYSFLFLLGFRVFLRPFFNLPVKAFYLIGTISVVLLLIAGGVYYLMPGKTAQAVIDSDINIERRPVDEKLLLIGVDGFWWEIIDPLMAEGKMPHVQALVDSGSSGPLETLLPTFSAMIWTSITTGKSEAKHGVTSFLVWKFPITNFSVPCHLTPKSTPEIAWMKANWIVEAPITNQFLDAEPVWTILSDHGASVGMVNWWVSWPANKVNGFIVTDHCLYNKSNVMQNYKSKEGMTPNDIYPVELLPELAGFSHGPDDITEAEIRRFINVQEDSFIDEFYAIDSYEIIDIAYEASMFKYSYPEDVTYVAASEYLLQTQQPDFMGVYLKGMDSMEHQYLKYYFADEHPDRLLDQNLQRYSDLIENYYIYMDETIGRLIAAADSNTTVMIVSDHGFDKIILPTGHYNHMEKPAGVFICKGSGIKQGHKVTGAHVYDVTPTVLHLLGFPMAEDFDGKALTDICTEQHEMVTITTYETGRRATRRLMESDIDADYKERLRALGYTQ